jgi:hypothetical protein
MTTRRYYLPYLNPHLLGLIPSLKVNWAALAGATALGAVLIFGWQQRAAFSAEFINEVVTRNGGPQNKGPVTRQPTGDRSFWGGAPRQDSVALLPADTSRGGPPVAVRGRYSYGFCTYYVASRRPVPPGWGHARHWYYRAQAAGWPAGSQPVPGAIAWTPAGWFGHVALVEEVAGDRVRVTEMNRQGWNRVSDRWTRASEFKYIY